MPEASLPAPVQQLSRFLPADFDPTLPVALIAGQRRYPSLLAERLRAAAIPTRLIAFEGETDPDLIARFSPEHRVVLKVGQLGRMLRAVQDFGARSALMAGQLSPRRLFQGLHPDWKAFRILASLPLRNAETIFGAIADELAQKQCRLLDARAFLDDQLATPGLMAGPRRRFSPAALAVGLRLAEGSASLDIGQSLVVARGTVLAVEAFEGTDAMLARAGSFRAKEALLIKTIKPCQDFRFDVPVFGLTTVETLAQNGIRAAALRADGVLMLDKPAVLEAAQRQRIQLFGWEPPPSPPT